MFDIKKMKSHFLGAINVILFGEGYGPKIQGKVGHRYIDTQSFILFDVYIDGWWLNRESVIDIAGKLNVDSVPIVHACATTEDIIEYIRSKPKSIQAIDNELQIEGVVCRTEPQLFLKDGSPLMFKLKCKDFKEGM